ncbi:large ribosomal subunit protein bL34m-like [Saccoglossus kowalevskii]|uniref:Large ribosomal subunit protein bL34m n=1 Tax=Saccoglossus kowalevskii TaxID=10224 RepID=A0ABM0GM30_SACKO|nr:PREDICTED: probable 54S ribosomal protein L34, mitochondrial-like [Saccoglossus kowalevskii]
MTSMLRNLTRGVVRACYSSLLRMPGKSGNMQQSKCLSFKSSLPNSSVYGHAETSGYTLFGNSLKLCVIQPCRTKARGHTYQPSVLKRIRKHGWHARLKSKSGIKVILRRMLKGRKILA